MIGLRVTAMGCHGNAMVKEECGGCYGLLNDTAPVPAQVKDEAGDGWRMVGMGCESIIWGQDLAEKLAHFFGRFRRERGDF
ncbi:hypothetical protein AA106556_1122 [Neokomagataea tanensis NBRC 106556]|uniref:Uncharacterized protein n=1 Tax=Neokomagataea tanensis NBRC 106556 TaxID=1223519 RepID=A0ABQ0QJ16_9PROT|nr:hypothetical protein AA106556_1122 [Neokomagataea tanensis NBRC 106556]